FNSNGTFTWSDVDTLTLGVTGTYTLLVEGAIADTGSGSYTVNVRPAPISTVPLTLGNQIIDAIAGIGEQDRYTFPLPGAPLLSFDSLTNSSSLTWTLAGPAGTAVSSRRFDSSDFANILNLPAGDYTLTIDGTGEATGPYSFHLWDLAQATAF